MYMSVVYIYIFSLYIYLSVSPYLNKPQVMHRAHKAHPLLLPAPPLPYSTHPHSPLHPHPTIL